LGHDPGRCRGQFEGYFANRARLPRIRYIFLEH
jgi:hypothetical protein